MKQSDHFEGRRRAAKRASTLLSLWAATVSCGGPGADRPGLEPPTAQEIAAGVFQGIDGIDGPITLKDGRWEGAPYVEGGASRPVVELMAEPRVAHDFDGDGRDEVAVVLTSTFGGSGVFVHLAVVEKTPDGAVSRAVAILGDRVQVRDARARGNDVVLDLVQHGEGDPACCPGDLVTRVWRMQGDRLTEVGGKDAESTPEIP